MRSLAHTDDGEGLGSNNPRAPKYWRVVGSLAPIKVSASKTVTSAMVITSTNPWSCCDSKISLTLIRSNVLNDTTDVEVPSILWWLLSYPSTCVCPYYIQICISLTYRIHITSDVRRNRNNTRSWVVVRSIKSVNFSEICVPRCEIFTLSHLFCFGRAESTVVDACVTFSA